MSAAFKLAKKKYTQNDLRRIMNETKANKPQANGNVKKIESPLAKYNDLGQLMCVLCKSVVRSESVWTVHVNAKQHKENVTLAKQLKEKTQNFTVASSTTSTMTPPSIMKRPASPPPVAFVGNKKVKGILKASVEPSASSSKSDLPSDFFDTSNKSIGKSKNFFETTLDKTSIRQDLVNIKFDRNREETSQMEIEESEETILTENDDKLPEGFFDDPVKDAKARNTEYKDPNDEEWEKFQKEIKEATNVSMAIINEEQEESTAERQITEIDDQIRNWSRVLSLEKQREAVTKEHKFKSSAEQQDDAGKSDSEEDEEVTDENFNEFLDWRAKKSYK